MAWLEMTVMEVVRNGKMLNIFFEVFKIFFLAGLCLECE